jgi:hypothetical protein
MQEPSTTQPASRSGHGEAVTILITGAVDSEYDTWLGGRAVPTVSVELPGQADFTQDIPYGLDGITLIPGDILPTLRQAALDAIDARKESLDERRVDGKPCADCANLPGGEFCQDCATDLRWQDQFEALSEGLGGLAP